ncbi:cytidine and dCMP deaminase domain-containing protein 1 [Spea bombifrons]|uniref:cytidine and dCMP deaminase domain-containing protein 1 n=1 Tax=Spea bombifrons TaxID=233779 RepID=UPI00234BB1A2|nr:cytidine and dCMP deaminase domain-containing protein 1 [Spea bombifrons]
MHNTQDPAETRSSTGTQTDSMQGQVPRLSKVNLFTLLSLWMEVFPSEEPDRKKSQVKKTGLVVVANMKVIDLHCSSKELHAGQIAVIKHGSRLKDCDLYFSRKPCSTCLKMIVNAGVNRISYWPADPEMSLQQDSSDRTGSGDAKLDAKAVERLKSNSRAHVCVLLQPLACYMVQFVEETSLKCDFIQKLERKHPDFTKSLFYDYRQERIKEYEALFLISSDEQHKEILRLMGLENLCENPYFINLRQNMKELVLILATVASSVPRCYDFGFYLSNPQMASGLTYPSLTQDIAWHCIIQARLLAYRTEDHKIGVGAVIWAEHQSNSIECDGTGSMHFLGCGYNAYPVGSEYADFPHMDDKQKDREIRKFRYIVHAEQNALTFRSHEIKPEEKSMIFVTKCPCDECLPLIKGAGIKQIYAGDVDIGKKKADISYMKFGDLKGVSKYTWQQNSHRVFVDNVTDSEATENGVLKSKAKDDDLNSTSKKMCLRDK